MSAEFVVLGQTVWVLAEEEEEEEEEEEGSA